MMNKIEKLLDLCIAVAEKYLEAKPGGQMPLPIGEQARSTEAPKPAETPVVEEPKKARKPRTPKEEPAAAAAPVGPSEGLEDQLGLGGEEPKKEKEMTEEESKARMEEVTKQYVSLCKNDQPEDGKTRAIALMKGPRFNAQKLGDLTHAQRLQWIEHMEAGIVAHK